MALPPMTIAVASYQRRSLVMRLLRALDSTVIAQPSLGQDLEIVVVLDGSTDGSREAVEQAAWRVPVRVIWQPNRGLASARNRGLDAAGDRVVWFLDDDLVPTDRLLARHRSSHDPDVPAVLVGACKIPECVEAPLGLRSWWDEFHADLESATTITRFDRFTAANTSGPAELFTSVGAFDERFTAYGLEDYELAYRLLSAGIEIRYAGDAVAWHPDIPPLTTLVRRQRSLGANAARLVALHPELIDELFPLGPVTRTRQLIRTLHVRQPWLLNALSRASLALSRSSARVSPNTSRRAELLARAAAHAAGVAEVDASGVLLGRLLGYRFA